MREKYLKCDAPKLSSPASHITLLVFKARPAKQRLLAPEKQNRAAHYQSNRKDNPKRQQPFGECGDPEKDGVVLFITSATKGKGYALNCSPAAISVDTATVSCDTVLTHVSTAPGHTNLSLRRINGHWIIVAAN